MKFLNSKNKMVYRVEIERGGKCCRAFMRPMSGGPRRRTGIPVLDQGQTDFKTAEGILTGYAHMVGWMEIVEMKGTLKIKSRSPAMKKKWSKKQEANYLKGK